MNARRLFPLPFLLLTLALAGCTTGSPSPAHSSDATEATATASSSAISATAELRQAVTDSDVAAARQAIARGADLEVRMHNGMTPVIVATKADDTPMALALIEAGADVNAIDDMQDSAFLYAGAEGLDEILAATLAAGADVESVNRYGGTALIPASEHGHVSTVKMLIAAGVPLDHVNNLGWTALHEAIVLGDGGADQLETIRLLLDAGADPQLADGNGVLPVELARRHGYSEIAELLARS
ncbi:ankyrin repeat domain-containing protein [Glutamicibacter endophyticus]|uniref:ankyrin repeat domain-containing protein n=1 Tax=Glutamicibacter endophyticus TaxID=1522174 RepID=UPI003AF0CEDE